MTITISLTYLIAWGSSIFLLFLLLLVQNIRLKAKIRQTEVALEQQKNRELQKLHQHYAKQAKELDLEIRARDRKLQILREELEKWQLAHEEIERALELEKAHAKEVEQNYKVANQTLQEQLAQANEVLQQTAQQYERAWAEAQRKIQTLDTENKLQNAEIARIKVSMAELEAQNAKLLATLKEQEKRISTKVN
ncbi:MAG: hypothetical protein NZ551_05720 [Microscillaceae bacterium]|nr:hypothetical protein [Microscillaceae bacterium]MDW8460695.1 hypothetical protein [Cytophagales bacterium]